MGKSGTNTVETSSQPPAAYLNAYTNVSNQASQVAQTPYQSYPGQVVAQLSPDQTSAIGQVEGLTANGGVQAPYLSAAQNDITAATQPVLTSGLQSDIAANSGQSLAAPTAQAVSGIQGATSAGMAGITGAAAGLTPASMQQWESPYTSQVLGTTEAAEANTDAQQQSQVTGNAISSGAFGGDRSAVASALTAGQQAIANNATNASIENQGYTTALGAAQQQAGLQTSAAESAGSLGLQGASAAGQAGMTGATTASQLGLQGASTTLGANEAQGWLSSQAGAGEANLGSEAQSTGLQGASALMQEGGIEQQMAQENLNVPYEEYLGAQAYPFQTTGWEAGLDEGLGASAGGTSTTTSPAASTASQVAGLGIAGLGLYNAAGGSSLFSGAASSGTAATSGAFDSVDEGAEGAIDSGIWDSVARGGRIEHASGGIVNHRRFASGGMTATDGNSLPGAPNGAPLTGTPLTNVPNMSTGIVPNAPANHGGMGIPKPPRAEQAQTLGQSMQQDVNLYSAAKKAGALTPATSSNARGGMVPARAMGGVIPTISVSGDSVSVNPASIVGDIKGPTGSTTSTTGGLSQAAQDTNSLASGVASIFGGPLGGLASSMWTNMFPQISPGALTQDTFGAGNVYGADLLGFGGLKRGGSVPHRDSGGSTGGTGSGSNVTVTVDPSQGTQSAAASPSWYAPMVQENLDNQMATMLAPTVAATDSTAMADPSSATGMKSGGTVPGQHFAVGGFTSSDMPYWTRQEENESVNRHGLLASPIAGRTDKLAVSPATGSYVIPADVISGLGEGNTLAGANVMQKILETGPHGIQMPQARRGMGPPRPPPAYREGEGDDGMASGGGIPHLATGGSSTAGATSGGMSPAVTSYLASNGSGGYGLPSGNGTYSAVPSTGINASTGQGSSATGNAALDSYLNGTEAGASFAPPATYVAPPPPSAASTAAAAAAAADPFSQFLANENGQQLAARGGSILHRAGGGSTPSDDTDMGLPDYSGHIVAPQFDDDDLPPPSHPVGPPPAAPAGPAKHEDPLAGAFPASHSATSPAAPPPASPPSQPNRMLKPRSEIKVSGGMQPASDEPPAGLSSSPPPSAHGDTAGMTPPTPPSNPSRGNLPGGYQARDIDSYLSRFQPTKPDPWLDVAQAGFAMAAGKSPHALENLGAGAEKGVASYMQQRQEASKEQQQAGETASRLADTDAYRQGMLGYRTDSNNIKASANDAMNQVRQRALALKAAGQDTESAFKQAQEEYMQGRLGVQQQQATTSATRATNQNNIGLANLAQKQEADDWREKYQQAQLQAQKEGRALTQQEEHWWHTQQGAHYATEEDANLAGKQNSITGKPMFPDPHATGQRLRDQNAPPSAAPPPAATNSPVANLWGN